MHLVLQQESGQVLQMAGLQLGTAIFAPCSQKERSVEALMQYAPAMLALDRYVQALSLLKMKFAQSAMIAFRVSAAMMHSAQMPL